MTHVIGTIFKKPNTFGDFLYMIKSEEFPNCLFIYNDDIESRETSKKGNGNASIRPFNMYGKQDIPKSAGITTGSLKTKGFTKLSASVKEIIKEDILKIKTLIKDYKITTLYYSADKEGLIGTSIFVVGDDVKEYITDKLKELNKYLEKNIEKNEDDNEDDNKGNGTKEVVLKLKYNDKNYDFINTDNLFISYKTEENSILVYLDDENNWSPITDANIITEIYKSEIKNQKRIKNSFSLKVFYVDLKLYKEGIQRLKFTSDPDGGRSEMIIDYEKFLKLKHNKEYEKLKYAEELNL